MTPDPISSSERESNSEHDRVIGYRDKGNGNSFAFGDRLGLISGNGLLVVGIDVGIIGVRLFG